VVGRSHRSAGPGQAHTTSGPRRVGLSEDAFRVVRVSW
jgi:hypothetical protein